MGILGSFKKPFFGSSEEQPANAGRTYHITHIRDLLAVPAERRAACVAEMLRTLRTTEELLGKRAPAAIESYSWVDDGLNDVLLTVKGDSGQAVSITELANAVERSGS